ncbi:MAG: nickel pincer cofactor biosynthesis protein LarC [Candidatus Lernaella stagnicola]|nr:nickel pincer cofactor biosynthesis protein LarC [Candidatus Lernaella stagnicola]
MNKVLYLECFAGAAGDMLVSALIDLGFAPERLEELLDMLHLENAGIKVNHVMRGAIHATLLSVESGDEQPHRHWTHIDALLADSSLPPEVKKNARRVFRRLAEAEGAVHGHSPETIHFHEVGAVDAIVDITGFCLGLYDLGITRLISSPLPLGAGETQSAHGIIPLPAPATVKLLADVPVYAYPKPVETVTPTGAALIATLAESFGPIPSMVLRGVGYGAGTRVDPDGPPNVVRALLGEDESQPETTERTVVIEANIDDMSPEYYEPLIDALEQAGALDVTLIPVIMKRGRPGVLLQVTAQQSALDFLLETTFTHSTTLGVRYYATERAVCERRVETVQTPHGPVRIKHAYYKGKEVGAKPEYKDLLALGLPIQEALAAVREARAKKD